MEKPQFRATRRLLSLSIQGRQAVQKLIDSGTTKRSIAEKIGVCESAFGRIVSGERGTTPMVATALSVVLNMPSKELWEGPAAAYLA